MIEEAEEFLERYSRKRKESTVKGRERDLEVFSDFLGEQGISLEEFDWEAFEDFLHNQGEIEGYSNHTVRDRYQSVKLLFDHLRKQDVVDHNPANDVKVGDFAKRQNKREELAEQKRVWLTKEEINKLVESAPQPAVRNRCLIYFMYFTACRRSEVANVKLHNLDFDERKVQVYSPKVDKLVTARWQPELDPLLNEWINVHRSNYVTSEESEYLFLTDQAEQVAPNHISRVIREAAERAGIQEVLYTDKQGNKRRKVTSHALRHSFAVHFLSPPNPGTLDELKEILGHEDVTTTQIYGEILEENVDESYSRSAPGLGEQAMEGTTEQTCERCGETKSKMITHHLSWEPEEVMEICSDCHLEIHNQPDEYEHLMPDISRKEANERGLI